MDFDDKRLGLNKCEIVEDKYAPDFLCECIVCGHRFWSSADTLDNADVRYNYNEHYEYWVAQCPRCGAG